LAALALVLAATACGDDDDVAATTTARQVETTAPAGSTGSTTAPAASEAETTGASAPTTGEAGTTAAAGTPAPIPLPQRTKLTAAILAQGVEAYSELLLADYFAEFEKENLEVNIVNLPSSDTLVGLISGDIDVTPSGYQANVFNAVQSGNDLAFVAPLQVPPDASHLGMWVRSDLVGDDGKFDPCEFKGRSVSFGGSAGLAATSSWWMSEYLAQCDLTVKDIQLSTLGGPDMLLALKSGALDAAFLFDPLWVQAEQEGFAKLVVPQPRVALGGYLFGSLRSEHPEVVEAFVRALLRTTRTYLQGDYHKDPKVPAALVKTLGVPEATVSGGLSSVFDPEMPIDQSPIVPMQQVWIDVGGILNYQTPVPAEHFFDTKFLDKVLTQK
jgi:NitT/TauT family transport system substrate-binding protein